MTLTHSFIETPFFTDPSGAKTSATNHTVTAGRLQLLVTWSYSDGGFPAFCTATNDFAGFDWTEILAGRLQLTTFLNVLGYDRYVQMGLFYGYATLTESGATTVTNGTVTTANGVNGRAGGWYHEEIAGFTTPPTDDGLSLMRGFVTGGAETYTQIFGGGKACRLDLAEPPVNADSLTVMFPLVESTPTGITAMYTADGTKDTVVTSSAYPAPSVIILRNSQDIYGGDDDDAGNEGRWTAIAFEVMTAPEAGASEWIVEVTTMSHIYVDTGILFTRRSVGV